METKRMRRSSTDKMIAGVCGGLGAYFNIDSTLIRLVFVLLLFAQGVGAILYLVLLIVLPSDEELVKSEKAHSIQNQIRGAARTSGDQIALILGGTLVVFGGIFLLEEISPAVFATISHFFWPAILILGGLALILRYQRAE
jgi:phage shock protein C